MICWAEPEPVCKRRGRRGGENVDEQKVSVTVRLDGVDDAVKAASELATKINEAKTLAGEFASLIEKLEVKVDV